MALKRGKKPQKMEKKKRSPTCSFFLSEPPEEDGEYQRQRQRQGQRLSDDVLIML